MQRVRFGILPLTLLLLVSLGLVSLSGCALSGAPGAPASALAGASIHGKAFGGDTPIVGSSIYMFAASTAGYGSANQSMLVPGSPGVLTDAAGNGYVTSGAGGAFTITSDYTCPSASTLVYLVALGGNPGLPGTVNNSAIAEEVLLGACGTLSAGTVVVINELSTVAAVSALAPFTSFASGAISSSPGNANGLANAFATSSNLVNRGIAVANFTTASGLGAIPYQELNTLADILSTCVNTSGPSSTTCSMLFGATASGGVTPINTLQAMLNIVRHPAQNVGTLYSMVNPSAPFQPTLSGYNSFSGNYNGQPNDWTLAIVYTTGNYRTNLLTSVNYLALDSQSNIWTAGNGNVLQFSNAGALNFQLTGVASQIGTNNYNQVLAVDLNDNLWIDDNSYAISEVTKAGVLTCAGNYYCDIPGAGSNYASVAAGTNYLEGYGGIAIDGTNTLWVGSASNSASSVASVNTSGAGLASYAGGGIYNPTSVAIDPSGNIWLANQGGSAGSPNTVTKLSPSGVFLSGASGFTGGGLNKPSATAFDHAGNAWIANQQGNSLTELSPAGVPLNGSPFTGGGLRGCFDLAIDGVGNIWVSGFGGAGVAEFSPSGVPLTPALGYFGGGGSDLGSVAIDSSGNVWVSSFDNNSINELVGVAAPTVTPVSVATKTGKIGVMP